MSFHEIKNFKFICDTCGASAIVRDVPHFIIPDGWGYIHPETSFEMFGTSKEVCSKCLEDHK